jgi:hypothetical protein
MNTIDQDLLKIINGQLNQHSKELAVLNHRIEVLASQVSGDESPLYLYMKTNDQRNNGIAASIQSITEQLLQQNSLMGQRLDSLSTRLRSEMNDRLQTIDIRLDEIQHVADNSKCAGEILELKVDEIRAFASQPDFPIAEGSLAKEAKPTKLRKSVTRPESTQNKQRSKYFGGRVQLSPIGDETMAKSTDSHLEKLQAEVQHLKDMVSRSQSMDDPKMVRLNQRIDECAKKSDLNEIIQCFMGAGANGACEPVSLKQRHFGERPRLAVPNDIGAMSRYPSVHVQLINGETLHRPATCQASRPRS